MSGVSVGVNTRPFDIKPTVFVAIFSLVLVGTLIVLQSRSMDAVETAAARTLEDGAARVNARQVGVQLSGRQVVSPELSPDAVALTDEVAPQLDDIADPIEVVVAGDVVSKEGSVTEDEPLDDGESSDVIEVAAPPTTQAATTTVAQAPKPATTTTAAPATTTTRAAVAPTTTRAPRTTTTKAPRTTTTRAPRTTTTTRAPRTTTTTTTTTTAPPPVNGRWSVAQVIDGTIGAGDGSNPNEESPMGRHDAPLYLPQGWNWAQGPTRNSLWGNLGSNQFAEFRCAVIPENGHNPPVPFRVNLRSGAYFQFANGNWNKAFDVALTSTANGGYLGKAGQLNSDPFSSGGPGRIEWRREADGSYSAPWNAQALMMHFWAGKRQSPASGQTAEFLTSEMRLQQPDGQNVDLSRVKVLFQCGIDYYNSTGGQGTKVPGPGIAKYHRLTPSWTAGLWVTLPGNAPAASSADFRRWLEANLPPDVRP